MAIQFERSTTKHRRAKAERRKVEKEVAKAEADFIAREIVGGKTRVVNFRIDEELWARFSERCGEKGSTASAVVRAFMRDYVK